MSGFKRIGFAAEMPQKEANVHGAHVSYANALNQQLRSTALKTETAPAEQQVVTAPKPQQEQEEPFNFTFPAVQVIRKVDRSRIGSEWRRYQTEVDRMARGLGLEALRFSEMALVLIDDDRFNSAMTERFSHEAKQTNKLNRHHQDTGTMLRSSATSQTVKATRRYIADVSRAHHQELNYMTLGESKDVQERMNDPDNTMWLFSEDDDTKEIIKQAYIDKNYFPDKLGELPDTQALLDKAYGLWQPYSASVGDEFLTNGPNEFGLHIEDDLGVLRSEATSIGQGISSKEYVDFKPGHFHIGKSMRWRLSLVTSDIRHLSDYPGLELPKNCPREIPLMAPIVTSQV